MVDSHRMSILRRWNLECEYVFQFYSLQSGVGGVHCTQLSFEHHGQHNNNNHQCTDLNHPASCLSLRFNFCFVVSISTRGNNQSSHSEQLLVSFNAYSEVHYRRTNDVFNIPNDAYTNARLRKIMIDVRLEDATSLAAWLDTVSFLTALH